MKNGENLFQGVEYIRAKIQFERQKEKYRIAALFSVVVAHVIKRAESSLPAHRHSRRLIYETCDWLEWVLIHVLELYRKM